MNGRDGRDEAGAPPENGSAAVRRLLQERARLYARPPDAESSGPSVRVLQFRVAGEQYAAEMTVLREVSPARGITPVPCTPAYVAGVLNVRGEIVTVLDLASALGGPLSGRAPDTGMVLLVEVHGVRAGLLVDELLGDAELALDQLDPPLSDREFIRGVAGAQTALLKLEELLSSGRFDVLEEVT